MKQLLILTSFFVFGFMIAQGPIAAYPFLGNPNDMSANALNGTLQSYNPSSFSTNNTPTLTTGHDAVPNSAYAFPPAPGAFGGYANIGLGQASQLNFGTNDFSISYWFKYTGTFNAVTHIANTGSSAYGVGFLCGMANNGGSLRPSFFMGSPSNLNASSINMLVDSVLTTNTWYNYVITVDRSANKIRFYLNGVQRNILKSTAYTFTAGTISGKDLIINNTAISAAHSSSLQMALSSIYPTTYFGNGALDDVYFFNRVLSPTEIGNIYNNILPAGINDNSQGYSLAIFPNPFNCTINIKDETNQFDLNTVKIYDILGKRVAIDFEIKDRSCEIVSANFESGIYFIELSKNDGQKIIKKMLKE